MAKQKLCQCTSCESGKCLNLLNHSVRDIRRDAGLMQRGEGSNSLPIPGSVVLADGGDDAAEGPWNPSAPPPQLPSAPFFQQ